MTMTENGRRLSGIALIKEKVRAYGSGLVFDQKTLEHARATIEKDPKNGCRARETLEMFGHLGSELQEQVVRGEKSVHVDHTGNMIISPTLS